MILEAGCRFQREYMTDVVDFSPGRVNKTLFFLNIKSFFDVNVPSAQILLYDDGSCK